MAGKVFISCGQRLSGERGTALAVKKLLNRKFGLHGYVAFSVQSLDDIMTITKELRSSDYYLFIDFVRRPRRPENLHVSLFTHQELALAHHLGFGDIIAFQQEGAPLDGFIRYILGNPESFRGRDDLLRKLEKRIRQRKWSREFSRNLTVQEKGFTGLIRYGDNTGVCTTQVWEAEIQNHRPDTAAIGSVCILDHIRRRDGLDIPSPDRSYLKWSGQAGYERTILPKDYGVIDLFGLRPDQPGLFLLSMLDAPREPVISENGEYSLFYKLFSQGFPLLEFVVNVGLRWVEGTALHWNNRTRVRLVKST
jgi:hypothetical protein